MQYQPPSSQNAYYQNYYNQQNYVIYNNRSNYIPNAPNYYPNGGNRYGQVPNPNASSPNIYPTYGNIQQMQPIRLDNAINKSSYSSSNRDLILDTILDNFSEKQDNNVFLQSLSSEKTQASINQKKVNFSKIEIIRIENYKKYNKNIKYKSQYYENENRCLIF